MTGPDPARPARFAPRRDYSAHCHSPDATAPSTPRRTQVPPTLDADAVRTWCALALDALGRAREEIDAINVYPVADGDTGTNLYLTVESAARAVDAVFDGHATEGPGSRPGLAEAVRAMAHGALIGARGNSGTILAQLLRGVAETLTPGDEGHRTLDDAERLRQALRRAVVSAYEGVARPVEGTVLTVAVAAADAASATGGADCADVARAAYEGARTALEATPPGSWTSWAGPEWSTRAARGWWRSWARSWAHWKAGNRPPSRCRPPRLAPRARGRRKAAPPTSAAPRCTAPSLPSR
ncbi:hypothetical protein GCM10020000_23050 [Streptomyces olivoverticillatus]